MLTFPKRCVPAYDMDEVAAHFDSLEGLAREYSDKRTQIDVAGLRDDKWIDLGECKWGTSSPVSLRDDLERKVKAFPNPQNATIGRVAFVKQLPKRGTREDDACRWYDLKSLYA